jgi:hypothetical protein
MCHLDAHGTVQESLTGVEGTTMNAIKKVRLYMQAHPTSHSARVLAHLAACLADERAFPLADLYSLDLEAFDLAIDLMRDWRLDRYYAARLKLLDTILADVLPELVAESAKVAQSAAVRTSAAGRSGRG